MGVNQWPISERPREKMLKYGVETLSNAELIALLIRSGTKEHSALALAETLLAREEGIRSLGSMGPGEYAQIRGIGVATACTLSAAVELGKRIAASPKQERIAIENSSQMAELFMEQMRGLNKEIFRVVHLNTKHEIIAMEQVSVGNLNSSIATPREVFHNAVRRSASAVILAHNHPSGNPEPSDADILLTARLMEAGAVLGIRVLDHIIIGDGIYTSMKDKGLMEPL